VLADEIYIANDQLPPDLRNQLIRIAAFQNPEFYKAQAMRLPTHDKPRIIACAEDHGQFLGLPRGCLDEVQALFAGLDIPANLRDERFTGEPLQVSFTGELRPDQTIAAEAMLAHDTGVLSATTAFGKTVVAAWLIAQRGVPMMKTGSCWRPEDTSARDSTTPGWTRYCSRCRCPGEAPSRSMSAACIAFMGTNAKCRYSTTPT